MINEADIDYRPLTEPVDRATFAAFNAPSKTADGSMVSAIFGTAVAAFGSIFALVVTLIFLYPVVAGELSNTGVASVWGSIILVGIVCLVGALIVTAVRHSTGPRGPWGRAYRLSQFAQANGLVAFMPSEGPSYPGAIFTLGSSRRCYDRIQPGSGGFIDIANYRYTTGSGKNKKTHTWG